MATVTTAPPLLAKTAKRQLLSAATRRDLRDGLLFTSPFILGVLLLWVGPMLYSIYLVAHDWNMITPPEFVGMKNFARVLADPLVRKSLVNTAYYTFLGVPLQLLVAFSLAVMLNQNVRGLGIYRTVYYLPSITPAVAFAVVWIQILNPEFGVLNNVLSWVGLGPINWLFNPAWAKPAFILMSLWLTGFQMIIFLAVEVEELSQLLQRYTPSQLLGAEMSSGNGQFGTLSDLAQLVAQRYTVRYQSLTSYRTLLARCDFSYQRATKQYKSRNEFKVMDFEEVLEKNS